jgi:hypothetical protein
MEMLGASRLSDTLASAPGRNVSCRGVTEDLAPFCVTHIANRTCRRSSFKLFFNDGTTTHRAPRFVGDAMHRTGHYSADLSTGTKAVISSSGSSKYSESSC